METWKPGHLFERLREQGLDPNNLPNLHDIINSEPHTTWICEVHCERCGLLSATEATDGLISMYPFLVLTASLNKDLSSLHHPHCMNGLLFAQCLTPTKCCDFRRQEENQARGTTCIQGETK